MQKNIVITGASSGIGAALAREYAAAGVHLGLLGRNAERLAETRVDCEAQGATVQTASIDVTAAEALGAWLEDFDTAHPIDLMVANAGISGGKSKPDNAAELTRRIFATNIDGVVNSIHPVAPKMAERKRGQIAIISSLAAMRGLPSAPAYSASKAAVRAYGEALRGSLGKQGVKVNVICPGYIKTPLTDVNTFPMPFLMTAEKAAKIIRRGLERNRSRLAFPCGCMCHYGS